MASESSTPQVAVAAHVVFNSGFVQTMFASRAEAERFVRLKLSDSPEVEIKEMILYSTTNPPVSESSTPTKEYCKCGQLIIKDAHGRWRHGSETGSHFCDANCNSATPVNHEALLESHKQLQYVVERFLGDLPLMRDWLDPDLENFGKVTLAKAKEITG